MTNEKILENEKLNDEQLDEIAGGKITIFCTEMPQEINGAMMPPINRLKRERR